MPIINRSKKEIQELCGFSKMEKLRLNVLTYRDM